MKGVSKVKEKYYLLNDGFAIPKLGLGTYGLRGSSGMQRIKMALHSGYRLIDSAFNYENEGIVGQAIRQSGISRDQITVTSKLPGRHHAYKEAIETIEESLARTGLDYLDLYLIHWPNPDQNQYVEAWQALIDAQKFGLIRSIGVSNFLPDHIDRLEKETGHLPVVNQLECHPYFNQAKVLDYHQSKQIIVEAWSPIGRGSQMGQEAVINDLAHKYNRSNQQIILAWHVARGIIPIPKSGNYQRQGENLAALDFELSQAELEAINDLSQDQGRLKDQNPAVYQEF